MRLATNPGSKQSQIAAALPQRAAPMARRVKVTKAPRSRCRLSADDEAAILAWMGSIGESDPGIIGEIVGRCRNNRSAQEYFLRRAAEG